MLVSFMLRALLRLRLGIADCSCCIGAGHCCSCLAYGDGAVGAPSRGLSVLLVGLLQLLLVI
jgi:hypothetical protein